MSCFMSRPSFLSNGKAQVSRVADGGICCQVVVGYVRRLLLTLAVEHPSTSTIVWCVDLYDTLGVT